jgi:hypothetical protein
MLVPASRALGSGAKVHRYGQIVREGFGVAAGPSGANVTGLSVGREPFEVAVAAWRWKSGKRRGAKVVRRAVLVVRAESTVAGVVGEEMAWLGYSIGSVGKRPSSYGNSSRLTMVNYSSVVHAFRLKHPWFSLAFGGRQLEVFSKDQMYCV